MSRKIFKVISKIIAILFLISCIVPVLVVAIYSFTKNWVYPSILPNEYTLHNFKYVYTLEGAKAIVTSTILAFFSSIISVLISIPTSKALAYYNFKLKGIITVFVLLPLIAPPFALVSAIQIGMARLGIDKTLIAVSLSHVIFIIPYTTRILYDYFKMVGKKYEITSYNLGATNFQTFKYITLPLIKQGILVSFFLGFTISISQYITTILVGGGKIITVTTLLVPYVQYGNYEIASVYSLLIIAISLSLYVVIVNSQKLIEKVVW